MTAIIKADATQPVRAFVLPAHSSGSLGACASAIDPAEKERAALVSEVERLRKELDGFKETSKEAVTQARAEGREAGLKEAARDEQGRSATLEKGMADALLVWERRLSEIDGLAALLTRAALAKLFADPAKLTELIVPAIQRQLRQVAHESIVSLRVSQSDFPDEDAVAAVSGQLAAPIKVMACVELSAGECFFDLQLGKADISLLSQWRTLESLLIELAKPEQGE